MFREIDMKQEIIHKSSPKELDDAYEKRRIELKAEGKIILFSNVEAICNNHDILWYCVIKYKA